MGLMVKNLPRGIPPGTRPAMLGLVLLYLFLVDGSLGIQAAPIPGDEPEIEAKAAVSIATDQQMDFGQLADKDGSVTLGLADSITSDPSLIHYGGSAYSGIYTLTGDPNTAVDISITATPGSGLTMNSFVSSEGNIPLIGVLLDPSGQLVLTVGATLSVDSATAIIGGGQSITFTITSTYN